MNEKTSETTNEKIDALARLQLEACAHGGQYMQALHKLVSNFAKETRTPVEQLKEEITKRAEEIQHFNEILEKHLQLYQETLEITPETQKNTCQYPPFVNKRLIQSLLKHQDYFAEQDFHFDGTGWTHRLINQIRLIKTELVKF